MSTRVGSGFRLVAERRLRRHAEFVRAQKLGRRVSTPHFTILVAPQPERASEERALRVARLGIVTSRKIGGAVQRNRVRRLCRECFRRWPGLVPDGVDLVVIAKLGAHELGLDGIEAEWRSVEGVLKRRAAEALAPAASKPHLGRGKPC
jgi:ribonuclease P protein component